jgi:hypothetical protein
MTVAELEAPCGGGDSPGVSYIGPGTAATRLRAGSAGSDHACHDGAVVQLTSSAFGGRRASVSTPSHQGYPDGDVALVYAQGTDLAPSWICNRCLPASTRPKIKRRHARMSRPHDPRHARRRRTAGMAARRFPRPVWTPLARAPVRAPKPPTTNSPPSSGNWRGPERVSRRGDVRVLLQPFWLPRIDCDQHRAVGVADASDARVWFSDVVLAMATQVCVRRTHGVSALHHRARTSVHLISAPTPGDGSAVPAWWRRVVLGKGLECVSREVWFLFAPASDSGVRRRWAGLVLFELGRAEPWS